MFSVSLRLVCSFVSVLFRLPLQLQRMAAEGEREGEGEPKQLFDL